MAQPVLLSNIVMPLMASAKASLQKAENLMEDYLRRSDDMGSAVGLVYRSEAVAGKTHMPYKDAIGRLNYWFQAITPILQSKGLLARLPEIAEARLCLTKDKWKRDGMTEDDFALFYYSVLKSVANYVDGSTVPTISWDTEPGDCGLMNSEGNPVADSPLYKRTTPKVISKWAGEEKAPPGAQKMMTRMMSTKGPAAAAAGSGSGSDSEEGDDDLFFDMPDDELDDFDAAMAVFNYMALPSFDKRKQGSDDDEPRRKKGEDEDDEAYFKEKKSKSKKKAVVEESESSDDEAELMALAGKGVHVDEDDDPAKHVDDAPIHFDADGVSSGLKDGEVF